jgi:capsular polysaccharide biosynthesis protein
MLRVAPPLAVGSMRALKSPMMFRKHIVIPVMPAPLVRVHALIGQQQRELEVFRPDPYENLTIVSHESESKSVVSNSWSPKNALKRWIEASAPPVKIKGYYLDTRFYEPNNIAHLLTQIVPLCLLSAKAVQADIVYVFRSLQPHFRELLEIFGITPLCTRRPVQGTAVEAFLSRNLDQYNIHAAPDPITSLIDGIYEKEQRSGKAKIYLSRRDSRSLTNESDVRSLLEARGYMTVYMEDWSIPEQISIARSAKDVVALHGAAMGYLVLCNGLNSVIELMPNHVGTAFFPIAFGANVRRYWQLMSQFDETVQFAGWKAIERHKNSPFRVDVNQLKFALDASESS